MHTFPINKILTNYTIDRVRCITVQKHNIVFYSSLRKLTAAFSCAEQNFILCFFFVPCVLSCQIKLSFWVIFFLLLLLSSALRCPPNGSKLLRSLPTSHPSPLPLPISSVLCQQTVLSCQLCCWLRKVSFWLFSIQRFSYLYSYDSDPAKTCPKVRILDFNTLPVSLTTRIPKNLQDLTFKFAKFL